MWNFIRCSNGLCIAVLLVLASAAAYADNLCRENSFDSREEAVRFWTPERRAKAKPMLMPVLSPTVGSMDPNPGRRYKDPSNPYPADLESRPFDAGGRLLFVDSDGDLAVCTAEFAGSQNILLTAAHCIQDPESGEWHSNLFFEQVYDSGNAIIVQIEEMTVRSEWRNGDEADPRFDYAFLVTEPRFDDYLTMGFDQVVLNLTSFGYPENYGLGDVMYAVEGFRGDEKSGLVLMEGNPMRHGSSGGAWVAANSKGSPGTEVVGLNSHGDDSIDNAVWSPVFDKTTESLLEYAGKNPCSGK